MFRLVWAMSFVLMAGAGQVIFRVPAPGVSCDTTLSSGANVGSAFSSAASGDVICLNAGSYSNQTFTADKTSTTTVRSTSGVASDVTFTGTTSVAGSTHLKLQYVSIAYLASTGGNPLSNFTVANSVGTGTSGNWEFDCSANLTNIIVEYNSLEFYNATGGHEGRLDFYAGGDCDAIVRYNTFQTGEPSLCSDGIQTDSSGIEIGPGNVFIDMVQGSCSAHVDNIQFLGASDIWVHGNYFENGSTFIMSPDSCSDIIFEDNVFVGGGTDPQADKLQFGSCDTVTFRHNTLVDVRVSFDSKVGESASSNILAENNILFDTGSSSSNGFKTANGNGCTTCTFRYNLYLDGSDDGPDSNCSGCSWGTGDVLNTPDWVGGATPSTWAGWQLDSGSPGENAGNDGQDMGTRYYGS
jgi:hypothetical protein